MTSGFWFESAADRATWPRFEFKSQRQQDAGGHDEVLRIEPSPERAVQFRRAEIPRQLQAETL